MNDGGGKHDDQGLVGAHAVNDGGGGHGDLGQVGVHAVNDGGGGHGDQGLVGVPAHLLLSLHRVHSCGSRCSGQNQLQVENT